MRIILADMHHIYFNCNSTANMHPPSLLRASTSDSSAYEHEQQDGGAAWRAQAPQCCTSRLVMPDRFRQARDSSPTHIYGVGVPTRTRKAVMWPRARSYIRSCSANGYRIDYRTVSSRRCCGADDGWRRLFELLIVGVRVPYRTFIPLPTPAIAGVRRGHQLHCRHPSSHSKQHKQD